MPGRIKTISDRSNFENILNQFFLDKNVFIRTKNGNFRIQYYGYPDETAAFMIPHLKALSGKYIIFARSGNNIIYAMTEAREKQEDDIFLFKIEKFEIILSARKEERKPLDSICTEDGESKNVIFITNIISRSVIRNSLSIDLKKTGKIKEYIQGKLSGEFSHIKIFFCNERKSDVRMGNFISNKRPIFIPKIDNNAQESDGMGIYIDNIYSKDTFLQENREYVSEITVPILYRSLLPYGYIQVNNTAMVSSLSLGVVKKSAMLADELLYKENVFPKFDGKLIVSDISRNGLGIIFKERKLILYFDEDSHIYFEILLPESRKASATAIVRGITTLDNNNIRVGCSIEEMDETGRTNYTEFLNSLPEEPEKKTPEGTEKENPEKDNNSSTVS